jgi:hypothetical protein
VRKRRRSRAFLRDEVRAAIRRWCRGFRGFALTIHCEDEEAVVRVHQQLREFDDIAALDSEPERSGWGYGFSFRDAEANVWGVAVKYGSDFDAAAASYTPDSPRGDTTSEWASVRE